MTLLGPDRSRGAPLADGPCAPALRYSGRVLCGLSGCCPHPAVLLSAPIASGAVDGLNTGVIVGSGHKHCCNVLYDITINTGLGLWRH